MQDRAFRILRHCCNGYETHSSGKEVEKNYSPDYVLKSGNNYVIIEHETGPNRKTVIADVFKAAYYLQNEKEGILVIVMTPKKGSSFESYPKHVLSYYKWLKERSNLKDVIFVHESLYYDGNAVLVINDEAFVQKSTSLISMMST